MSDKRTIQWKYLTQEFLELDDIVDRTFEAGRLSAPEMQKQLIQLYETYVYEWKIAESIIKKGLVNKAKFNDQQIAKDCLNIIPKS